MNSNLLSVQNLKVHFPVRSGLLQRVTGQIKAVDGVSFEIQKGETVGLVGESGSGKSTIGKSIVRLVEITEGSVHYHNHEISSMNRRGFLPYRKKIQMIFQDPYNSLNPRMTVEQIVGEALDIHFRKMGRAARRTRILELLDLVGLQGDHIVRYPHEFSGGQRQRIGIARALAVEPEFIVCDEPVSALDVSVQAQIVNLLQDLQKKLGLTYLFISHDLAVVEHLCDQVLVMTEGKIVENGTPDQIYNAPKHAYTRKLLDAVPKF
ncbi:MAG: ATP-binding cassette domain-containing protein [Methylacidiphilales bacterium]|nr:ATP-binding cassette domain-containing protein [Candidatus Methylacidiphilales bacterium]